MCPMCWAATVALFGALLALSVVWIAATDIWTMAAAMVLGLASAAHRSGFVLVPWWVLAGLAIATICRVGYLLAFNRNRLLFVQLWGRACRIAACAHRGALRGSATVGSDRNIHCLTDIVHLTCADQSATGSAPKPTEQA